MSYKSTTHHASEPESTSLPNTYGAVPLHLLILQLRGRQDVMYEEAYQLNPDAITLLEDALDLFLRDPSDPRNLP